VLDGIRRELAGQQRSVIGGPVGGQRATDETADLADLAGLAGEDASPWPNRRVPGGASQAGQR
jgi:hypothetical protein